MQERKRFPPGFVREAPAGQPQTRHSGSWPVFPGRGEAEWESTASRWRSWMSFDEAKEMNAGARCAVDTHPITHCGGAGSPSLPGPSLARYCSQTDRFAETGKALPSFKIEVLGDANALP